MKLHSLLAGIPLTGGTADMEMEITSISWDTRTLQPGSLFVALSGRKENGENHLAQALEKGAAAVLCGHPPQGPGPYLLTPDPREGLARAAANWYGHPGRELVLIGVTGTNGKTTTTHLIKSMLEQVLHTKVGLIGTVCNLIGEEKLPARRTTPEACELQRLLRAMADGGCTHVVMEVSSHALVQRRTAGLSFAVGVFTNLSRDHLDYHGTMEEYRRAKGRLFLQSERGVVNLDDEAGRLYADEVPIPLTTYSESRDSARLTAKNIRLFPTYVEFEGVTTGQIARVRLPIPGGFTIYNGLAALGCGLALGLPLGGCAAALRTVQGVKGRVEVVPVPAPYTVLIDYAHTPDALENILLTARGFTRGRLMCLFGCGGDRDRSKRAPMGAAAGALADVVVVTSDNPRTEQAEQIIREILPGLQGSDALVHVDSDRRSAIFWALERGEPGDVIVLAGKGHETEQEIDGICHHMDEREIVAEYFQRQPAKKEENRL